MLFRDLWDRKFRGIHRSEMFVAGVQWNQTNQGLREPDNVKMPLLTSESHWENWEPWSASTTRYTECQQQPHQKNWQSQ